LREGQNNFGCWVIALVITRKNPAVPILVTLLGIVKLIKVVKNPNVLYPILLTPTPRMILVRLVQEAK
jgi:hypothetical protein